MVAVTPRGQDDPARILVLMGASGAGKSTVAARLRDQLGCRMLEGDDVHAPASLARMAAGEGLDDADRLPWLHDIAAWIEECVASGEDAVVACSALKRRYRDVLRRPEVTFVHLDPPPDVLAHRLERRVGHHVPASLLDSQLAALEPPGPDEQAFSVHSGTPDEQRREILDRLDAETRAGDRLQGEEDGMQLGMVGLGRMGSNMAQRLRERGHRVVGYDLSADAPRDAGSLQELVAALDHPRVVWLMLPAGAVTLQAVAELAQILDDGDLVVDGANSRYTDDRTNADLLAERGVDYVDAGISGGIHGLREGYGVMVGGRAEAVARLAPVFAALAPAEGGFVHAGPVGAGHFAKMVHNGIEYGIMQAYGEGYELLQASELIPEPDAVVEAWRHGTVIRSWLLDLLAAALADDPQLAATPGYARDSGEGRWAVEAGVLHGVPLPVMSAALFARFASRREQSPAMQVVAALRSRFGGHATGAPGEPPVAGT